MNSRPPHRSRRVLALLVALAVCSPCTLFGATNKLLVKNARLFTMAARQHDPFLGYLVVAEDGTIVTIAAGDPPANLSAVQVFDAHGDWIIPGFISAHSHLWQAAYHGIAADDTLISWIDNLYLKRAIKANPEDLYWFCLLGSLDHLQRGVTTAYDFKLQQNRRTGHRQRVR
jgi:5-methylthioadenosine/S-adenosylhomocysteine deaminase